MEFRHGILGHLPSFEDCFTGEIQKHLEVEKVWDRTWTQHEKKDCARATRWRRATGVYFFVDDCTKDDINGVPPNGEDRYSVIRRLGSATYSFGDRVADYGHRERCEPGPQKAWNWDRAIKEWVPWFRYGRIYIIRVKKTLAIPLERFLLERIRTQFNDNGVPLLLKSQPPPIFDNSVV